jgi:hypothetical protein
VDDFVNLIPNHDEISNDTILKAEMAIITGIKFHLYVFEPYSSLHGYGLDLQSFIKDPEQLTEWLYKAKEYLDVILLTDAIFLYVSSQIALSSLQWAALKLHISMESYIEQRFGGLLKMYEDII